MNVHEVVVWMEARWFTSGQIDAVIEKVDVLEQFRDVDRESLLSLTKNSAWTEFARRRFVRFVEELQGKEASSADESAHSVRQMNHRTTKDEAKGNDDVGTYEYKQESSSSSLSSSHEEKAFEKASPEKKRQKSRRKSTKLPLLDTQEKEAEVADGEDDIPIPNLYDRLKRQPRRDVIKADLSLEKTVESKMKSAAKPLRVYTPNGKNVFVLEACKGSSLVTKAGRKWQACETCGNWRPTDQVCDHLDDTFFLSPDEIPTMECASCQKIMLKKTKRLICLACATNKIDHERKIILQQVASGAIDDYPISFLQANPKLQMDSVDGLRQEAAARFEKYKTATTIRQALDYGATPADLAYDIKRHWAWFDHVGILKEKTTSSTSNISIEQPNREDEEENTSDCCHDSVLEEIEAANHNDLASKSGKKTKNTHSREHINSNASLISESTSVLMMEKAAIPFPKIDHDDATSLISQSSSVSMNEEKCLPRSEKSELIPSRTQGVVASDQPEHLPPTRELLSSTQDDEQRYIVFSHLVELVDATMRDHDLELEADSPKRARQNTEANQDEVPSAKSRKLDSSPAALPTDQMKLDESAPLAPAPTPSVPVAEQIAGYTRVSSFAASRNEDAHHSRIPDNTLALTQQSATADIASTSGEIYTEKQSTIKPAGSVDSEVAPDKRSTQEISPSHPELQNTTSSQSELLGLKTCDSNGALHIALHHQAVPELFGKSSHDKSPEEPSASTALIEAEETSREKGIAVV